MTAKMYIPVDNFGTVVGETPSCYGILSLWAVNRLSIVCWDDEVICMASSIMQSSDAWVNSLPVILSIG